MLPDSQSEQNNSSLDFTETSWLVKKPGVLSRRSAQPDDLELRQLRICM
jgi:hypothetical protein